MLETNNSNESQISDPDLQKVGVALRRAAKKALELGLQTNTPVYVMKNNEIIDLTKNNEESEN